MWFWMVALIYHLIVFRRSPRETGPTDEDKT